MTETAATLEHAVRTFVDDLTPAVQFLGATVEGIDRVLPVDVYIPGCPPRPEGLIYGMMKLQQLIKDRRGHWPDRAIGPNVPDGI